MNSQAVYRGGVLHVDKCNASFNARLFVVAALADWGLWAMRADVVLCASELVGNVAKHALRPASGRDDDRLASIGLRSWPHELFLEVGDHDPRFPAAAEPQTPGADLADGGRGLQMVRALADGLFWKRADDGGKVVYCRFALASHGVGGVAGGALA
ncbi:ATP-binding protein [Wenjunlia tyrosinilytica]|uniref:ATP-binding protein n=1 Tax=Wenjunlia tyrosinilytica TaxID=1544741 RepID=UPI0016680AEE|nr:ATP-binding protein [Wenjunlia tyrosinilytica]